MKYKFYWVKFYPTASWQPAKVWKEDGIEMIFGLDWASPAKLNHFKIAAMILIEPPAEIE